MEIAVIVLSIAVLGAVVLLVFMHNSNVMSAQAIADLHKENDSLQEKRITEIRESLKANETVTKKLTEAAAMYNQTGRSVADKINEAIEVMNGNQYAIIRKLEEMNKR